LISSLEFELENPNVEPENTEAHISVIDFPEIKVRLKLRK